MNPNNIVEPSDYSVRAVSYKKPGFPGRTYRLHVSLGPIIPSRKKSKPKQEGSTHYQTVLIFQYLPQTWLIRRISFSFAAWVGSIAMSGCGLFGPLSGRLTNHFGARIVVASGSLLSASGLLLTSLVPSLFLMFLTYGGVFGFGFSLVFIAVFEIVPRYFVKYRSMATGIIAMSTGGALVVMTPVCEALLRAFGWRGTFGGLGCLVFIVFFISWLIDPNVASDEVHTVVEHGKESDDKHKKKILDLSMWKNKSFAILTLSHCVIYIGHYVVPLHLVSIL